MKLKKGLDGCTTTNNCVDVVLVPGYARA